MTHTRKTWPQYFEATITGLKLFEIRSGEFNVGDILVLEEFDPCPVCDATGEGETAEDLCPECSGTKGKYTGRAARTQITYMTRFKQPVNQVVLGIEVQEIFRQDQPVLAI